MPRLTTLALPLLALAACNQQSTTDSAAKTGQVSLTNASVEEVAKQATAAGSAQVRMRPGQWESRVEIVDMDMPGMPEGPMRAQMLAKMKQSVVTTSQCVTQDQSEKPDASLFSGRDKKNPCRYDKFSMGGGTIDAKMSCPSPNGAMTMTLHGSFSPDAFSTDADMTMADQKMHMRAKTSGKRIGECKPGA